MKVISFMDHYSAVNKALVETKKEYDAAMWLLDYSDDDADTALKSAEIAEACMYAIKEEDCRLSTMVDVEKKKHSLKYPGPVMFDMEWAFRSRSISVGSKVANILNY